MIAWLVEPWAYAFMRWALVCCLVLGGIHAYLGFHVVRRGVLFVDLAMAQMSALGAAIGVVLGHEHGTVIGYVISLGCALAAAALFAFVRSRRVSHEAIIAIVYAVAMAATFIVLEHSPHGMDEVRHLLIGQILTVDPVKVLMVGGLYAVIGLVHARLHPLTAAVSAGRSVPRTRWLELFFYGSFAVVVTSSVALVGVLLVFCFLVIPAVAATLLAVRDMARLALGWAFALVGGLLGLHLAFYADTPASPMIVLVLGAIVCVTAVSAFVRRSSAKARASIENPGSPMA
jgi:zinc/manganese transport system permease protein